MTFLELVERYLVECDVPHSPLTTLTGLTGELLRAKNWVSEAWMKIQSDNIAWRFRTVSTSHVVPINTIVQNPVEFAAGQLAEWKVSTMRIDPNGVGYSQSKPMKFIEWDIWQQREQLTAQNYGEPNAFTIRDSDHSLLVSPGASTSTCTLYFDYFRAAQKLTADVDVPIIPIRDFDMIIVYEAMIEYGYFDAAPEVLARAERQRRRLLNQLTDRYGPRITMGSFAS